MLRRLLLCPHLLERTQCPWKTIELNDNSAIKNAALWPEGPQVIVLQVIPVYDECLKIAS